MNHPLTPRVRVTVPVTEDTLEVFQHYAKASGVSVGRAMADWLAEQLTAVQWAALRFEEVRAAPRDIALQLVPQPARMPAEAGHGPVAAAAAAPATPKTPRPVIRGGKSPSRGRK